MSPELGLMIAPRETYAALSRDSSRGSFVVAVRRPLLVAIVLGVSVAISATGRAEPALVASTTLTWSYIVLLQIAIAVPFMVRPARRTVGLARAIDLFYAGHAPWSLVALAVAAWTPVPIDWPSWPLLILAAGALILTVRSVAAFFEGVLRLSGRDAWRRTAAQQAITWTVFLAMVWVTSSLTPRVFELLGLS